MLFATETTVKKDFIERLFFRGWNQRRGDLTRMNVWWWFDGHATAFYRVKIQNKKCVNVIFEAIPRCGPYPNLGPDRSLGPASIAMHGYSHFSAEQISSYMSNARVWSNLTSIARINPFWTQIFFFIQKKFCWNGPWVISNIKNLSNKRMDDRWLKS